MLWGRTVEAAIKLWRKQFVARSIKFTISKWNSFLLPLYMLRLANGFPILLQRTKMAIEASFDLNTLCTSSKGDGAPLHAQTLGPHQMISSAIDQTRISFLPLWVVRYSCPEWSRLKKRLTIIMRHNFNDRKDFTDVSLLVLSMITKCVRNSVYVLCVVLFYYLASPSHIAIRISLQPWVGQKYVSPLWEYTFQIVASGYSFVDRIGRYTLLAEKCGVSNSLKACSRISLSISISIYITSAIVCN